MSRKKWCKLGKDAAQLWRCKGHDFAGERPCGHVLDHAGLSAESLPQHDIQLLSKVLDDRVEKRK